MSLSLILTCVWFILANVLAMLPSNRKHWPQAWGLIAIGIPLLGYVAYQHGPWVGLLVMAAAISVLRWPVFYLLRWMRKLVR